ncbi:hypothetical protein SAY87_011968 [Trapa incisa]|uniref:Amino acid transporter transmembrane domain-containing protein n=1 Tax=Trapa incisa TaxID=236973 RepID=A0AAN7JBU2_9MYRT|nr:hypothetical protein SAY87_011968 [Trapa incisa]
MDQWKGNSSSISLEEDIPTVVNNNLDSHKNMDDDGRIKRTGTVTSASAHIITAVIGSGVLSLAWAIAQLGWTAGPAVLMAFSLITYFTSTVLADSYRSPDPITGKRNYTYMDVVRSNLGKPASLLMRASYKNGGWKVRLCGLAQYGNIVGTTIGYTITASISMVAVIRSNCFHNNGHLVRCHVSNYPFMVIFACIEIVLCQIPNFHKLSWLSVVASVMSFAYSSIGIGLSIARIVGGAHARTTLTGVTIGVDVTAIDKVWRTFQAIGNIAFAYSYSMVLDTLKSSPPENKVMKKASLVGVTTTTLFYMMCGCIGYAAFGNDAPGNFLTGFGFYEPFWLIDIANVCTVVHIIGAYQVFVQPFFGFVEKLFSDRWPESNFINREIYLGSYNFNMFRLTWRTVYVIIITLVAMIFPFFNDILGLLGALTFWPLTVFFPVEIYLARTKMKKYSLPWTWMKILSLACLVVSLLSALGSVQGLVMGIKTYKPFSSR